MSVLKTSIAGRRQKNHHASVVQGIGKGIVDGTYPVDSILPGDAELVERFGVSRTVLREAMKTLAAKGLVKARARVGTKVTPPEAWNYFDPDVLQWHLDKGFDKEFLGSITEIRSAMEPTAARLSALRMGDAEKRALVDLCDAMAAATSKADFLYVDLEFHRAILAGAGNPFLQSAVYLIEAMLAYSLTATPVDEAAELIADGARMHRHIADAILAGDGDAAAKAMAYAIGYGHDIAAQGFNSALP